MWGVDRNLYVLIWEPNPKNKRMVKFRQSRLPRISKSLLYTDNDTEESSKCGGLFFIKLKYNTIYTWIVQIAKLDPFKICRSILSKYIIDAWCPMQQTFM